MGSNARLNAFKANDSGRLYLLAKQLYNEGFFNCYMTPQLFNVLTYIFKGYSDPGDSRKVWDSLMNCNLIMKIEKDPESMVIKKQQSVIENEEESEDSESEAGTPDVEKKEPEISAEEQLYISSGHSSVTNLCTILRYLLYEKAVDYFYNDSSDDTNFKEFRLLDADNQEEDDIFKDAKEDLPESKTTKDDDDNYDDDEDDYDDDDDDDDDDKKESKDEKDAKEDEKPEVKKDVSDTESKDFSPADAKDAKYFATLEVGDHGETIIRVPLSKVVGKPEYPSLTEALTTSDSSAAKVVHPILSTTSAIESNLEKQNELKLIKNYNKVYHGFEYDLPNIVKRRRLEKSNKQLEIDSNERDDGKGNKDGKIDRNVSKLADLGGAANLSLKNLLGRIEDNREKLNITDIELKNLVMDVRKNRSKWANYNRIGQEELYEACEKVVTELRGYTEHSTPFLNRVSKREAPNYYEIIKKPMDLNTVMRKLRTLQYNSKKQFVDDLMLIWQNCLTYNSDPKHYLRVDALAMQKKTQSLVSLIPNIVIRDRAEVEHEAAAAARAEKDEQEQQEARSKRGVGKTGPKKGAKKHHKDSESDSEGETDKASAEKSVERASSESSKASTAVEVKEEKPDAEPEKKKEDKPEEEKKEEKETSHVSETPAEESEDDNEELREIQPRDEEDEAMEDLELSTWKTMTANARYKICEARTKLFKDNKIHPNVVSLCRDSRDMDGFLKYLDDSCGLVLHKTRKYFDENDDPYLIEYDVRGGIPSTNFHPMDYDMAENKILEQLLTEGKTLDSMPESSLRVNVKGSNKLILDNITAMQEIRRVCFRINLIRQMQTTQFMHRSQLHAPPIETLEFHDVEPISRLPTRDIMNADVASKTLQKSIATILMATGFESANPGCTTLLTEIAQEYYANLAKSLKLHMESNSINKLPIKGHKPLDMKDIISMTLKENGIDKPDIIYTYFKEYLKKKSKKLNDLKDALEEFLKDLLRPGLQDLSESQFSDNSDQFVTGEFSEELGEDFFGFKELGLDKEFGILVSSVPLHLLHSRLSYQFNQNNNKAKTEKFDDFKEFKFPKLRKKDLPNQIGVLNHYYKNLLIKTQAMYSKQLRRHQQHVSNGTPDPNEKFVEFKNPEDLVIIEDDDLPIKQRNNRPKIPPNGRITQTKKKVIANSFFIDDQDKWIAEEGLKSGAKVDEES